MSSAVQYDVAIIGSGFGGLGAALSLAERGYKVGLFETLKYPGGCAGTFARRGYRFEAGATLSSGFGEHQLFKRWIDQHHLDIELEWLDPVVHFRAPQFSLDIPPQRERLIDLFLKQPDAPRENIKRFFNHQAHIADTLWALFDDADLLPPWNAGSLWRHLKRSAAYLPMMRDINRSLFDVLARYGLDQFKPLTLYLDALCQITVQCGLREAEAPFALSTMDYYGRGTAHVIGGLGRLAESLCQGIAQQGGDVRLSDQVKEINRSERGGFELKSRKGVSHATCVVSNLLPSVTQRLIPKQEKWPAWSQQLQSDLEHGWSAAMLYLVGKAPESASGGAEHWQMIGDSSRPMREGNHIFCSISHAQEHDRAPEGSRTMTVSTHIPAMKMRQLNHDEHGDYISGVQAQMRETFRARCPEWAESVYFDSTASPRTFERFTGRDRGMVGGAPRRRGWRQYLSLGPRQLLPGLYLVGDSVFPGQSTLATATGGTRVAEHLHRSWSRVHARRSPKTLPHQQIEQQASSKLSPLQNSK